jgi:glycosyltransferase involved in cell wall biosynthesis
MRILFCSQTHLSKELGASKVLIELAEEMTALGWQCEFLSPAEIAPNQNDGRTPYHFYLRQHLQKVAGEFDVVEYDHNHLPYARSEFPKATLFVARSVLLAHHFENIAIPLERGVKAKVYHLLKGRKIAKKHAQDRPLAYRTVEEADLVNVLNYDDERELIRCGISKERIVVIPNGLSRTHQRRFGDISSEPPQNPLIAFIGTFDTRKGETDFPSILKDIYTAVPGVRFRLLGTFKNEAKVHGAFPKRLRERIEVVPRYRADDLPALLAPCSAGVFPSYIEGFGLGVLEMLAASIPVIAYHSPGPPMMLSAEYLVPRGNTKAMSSRVIELLQDRSKLMAARYWAKQRSQDFCWQQIARQTSEIYTRRWQDRQMRDAVGRMRQGNDAGE